MLWVPITDDQRLREITRQISPITFVTPDDPPTLIIHGDGDTLVPLQQSEVIVDKFKKTGVEAKLVVKKGAGHGWAGLEKDLIQFADWFDQHLKKGSTQFPSAAHKLIPQIDGDWWQIAGNPDLGELTGEKQQPVDFAIWQAEDGTWQLWSCIRQTKCGGKTRLFYRWEGKALTDANWTPRGIAMKADPDVGETNGGLQAPHVIRRNGTFLMFYGDWQHIALATSNDGKTFNRHLNRAGTVGLFDEGPGSNTRDPMVLPIGDVLYCYYTAFWVGREPSIAACRGPISATGVHQSWSPSEVRQGPIRSQPSVRTWSSSMVTITFPHPEIRTRCPDQRLSIPETRSTSGSRMIVASSAPCPWRLPRSFGMTGSGSSPR